MAQTNEAQFIASIPTADTPQETREITLLTETWEKLDEIISSIPMHRDSSFEEFMKWLIPYYIWLCEDGRYRIGIRPTPQRPTRNPNQA